MAQRQIHTILKLRDQMSTKLFKVSKNVKGMSKDMQRVSRQSVNMANKFAKSADKMVAKAGNFVKLGAKMGAVASGAGAVALAKQSDEYASIQARLRLINDGQQTVEEFNKKIFKSAGNARVEYNAMASSVAKLGVLAGNAFKGNDEILEFSNLMSKSFKVGGASAQEQTAAMYQLTQAMAAGKLQGDEFRSIMENAPMLAQAIAKEMDIPMGQLKEMSSQGVITADIIKNAMFNSADDINSKFSQMPKTFGETITGLKNSINQRLQPTLQRMSDWLNSDKGKAMTDKAIEWIEKIVEKIPAISEGIEKVYKVFKKVFKFILKHQDIIIFIATFALTVGVLVKAVVMAQKVFAVLQVVMGLFNGTLAVSPIGWVILSIGALIAIGVLLWKNWDTVKTKASELWGHIKEVFGGVGEWFNGIWESSKTGFRSFINFMIDGLNTWISFMLTPLNFLIEQANKLPMTNIPKVGLDVPHIPAFAKGVTNFESGLAQINERGGEIVRLPNGSDVIPADKSKRLIGNIGKGDKGKRNPIIINIDTFIGKPEFADEIGERIYRKVYREVQNTA